MNENLPIKNNSKSRRNFLGDVAKWIGGTTLLATAANIFTSNKITASTGPNSTQAELEPMIGSIDMVGFNFAPRNWALCNGQLQAISTNTALFSLLGTIYGGDGRTTFALPDLQGRVPIHWGHGPGLSTYVIGERGGQENVTLTTSQIPSHNHTLNVNSSGGTSDNPTNNFISSDAEGVKHYRSDTSDGNANSLSIGSTGSSQSHNNMQPYLAVTFIIALFGVFPSRS